MIKTTFIIFFLACCSFAGFTQQKAKWTPLFNKKDISNWDTWLRSPNQIGYLEMEFIGEKEPAFGLNNDPLKVFTVNDGILRISGEAWGAITTRQEYGNYHLRFDTKWGEKKYFPKDKSLRDGGLLFHCTDSLNFAFNCWMRSLEMQIQETEIGDFFNVSGGVAEFQVKPGIISPHGDKVDLYDAGAPLVRHPGRVYRSGNFETPANGWTRGEMIARHADAVFIVNGFVVNRLFNIFRDDLNAQVVKGKLQFQSEGAEHFYKTIEIRPISFKQTHPLLSSDKKELSVETGKEHVVTIRNSGEPVEIIAVELIGDSIDHFIVKLPAMPMMLKKNSELILPVKLRDSLPAGTTARLRLETVLGPIEKFEIVFIAH